MTRPVLNLTKTIVVKPFRYRKKLLRIIIWRSQMMRVWKELYSRKKVDSSNMTSLI